MTNDIAKKLGINRITASRYLNHLREKGEIDFIGIKTCKVWFILDEIEKSQKIIDDIEKNISEKVGYAKGFAAPDLLSDLEKIEKLVKIIKEKQSKEKEK